MVSWISIVVFVGILIWFVDSLYVENHRWSELENGIRYCKYCGTVKGG